MGRKSRFSRDEWSRLVAEQLASGLSAAVFCQQKKLTLAAFYRWRRKLSAELEDSATTNKLVSLEVISDDRVDVELSCGATIKLPVGNEIASHKILSILLELGRVQ